MAIEVNSAGWTGNEPSATAPQVCGEFHDKERLDEAMSRLEGSLFQRADLSLRIPGQEDSRPNTTSEEPMREDDARNLRQLGVGLGSYAAATAAAGAVIATGGAALPAVAAAAAAAGGAAVVGEGIGQAAAPEGENTAHQAAEIGGAVLMVHADTPEKQAKAEELLQACGATRVWRQGGA